MARFSTASGSFMFRRSRNSAGIRGCAVAVSLVIAAPGPAFADPPAPMVMGPLYSEPGFTGSTPEATCSVTIADLSDPRRAPEVLGMMGNRSIVTPPDRMAWLRSVFDVGLRARGFDVTFAAPDAVDSSPDTSVAPPPEGDSAPAATLDTLGESQTEALTLRVSVRSIWLATVGMNKTATVVLRVAQSRGEHTSEADYRGSVVLANWAGTRSESNGAIERAFARALDAIAADARPLCNAVD